MRAVLWVAGAILILDQATKYLVVHVLNLRETLSLEVLPPVLNLRMAWNYGINFGILASENGIARWLLIGVAVAISGAVLWWVRHDPAGRWQAVAAGLLIGGAAGNVIDRLVYGAVADFLNMSCCGIDNPYSFNVADVSIFAGALGLVIFGSGKTPRDAGR